MTLPNATITPVNVGTVTPANSGSVPPTTSGDYAYDDNFPRDNSGGTLSPRMTGTSTPANVGSYAHDNFGNSTSANVGTYGRENDGGRTVGTSTPANVGRYSHNKDGTYARDDAGTIDPVTVGTSYAATIQPGTTDYALRHRPVALQQADIANFEVRTMAAPEAKDLAMTLSPDDMRTIMARLLLMVGFFAKLTPTDIDDKAVAFLTTLANTPGVVELVLKLLGQGVSPAQISATLQTLSANIESRRRP